jgi:hypothetical protein
MTANQGGISSLTSRSDFEHRFALLLSLVVAFCGAGRLEAALTFDTDFSPGVLATPKAAGIVASVHAATSTWSSIFRDDITVSLLVEMDSEATDIDFPSPFAFAAALNAMRSIPTPA